MQQFPQPQANLVTECKNPPVIPNKNSSYRELEKWSVETLGVWAECASNKKALVDSWPKNK